MQVMPPEIHVSVSVRHLPEQSTPQRQLFAYWITIQNGSDDSWQLLSRVWDIVGGDGRSFRVEGEGVVGEQPILAPGASYSYNSFVTIDVLPGHMGGHYVMQNAWGERAEVSIPTFLLAAGERVLN